METTQGCSTNKRPNVRYKQPN